MTPTECVSDLVKPGQFEKYRQMHCPTVYDEISCYQPKDEPLRPWKMGEFLKQPREYQRDKSAAFYAQDDIREYMEANCQAQLYNRDCFLRLFELLGEHKDDQAVRHALEVKLAQFKAKIQACQNQVPSLRPDLSKYGFNEQVAVENADWAV